MNQLKTYFQFTGTISGTTFLLRNILNFLLSFCTVVLIGYSISITSIPLMIIGFLSLVMIIWFSVSTLFKRMNALYTFDAALYTAGFFSLQCVNTAMDYSIIRMISSIVLFIGWLFLIIKDSNIENHKG